MWGVQCYYFKIDLQKDKPKSFGVWQSILLQNKKKKQEKYSQQICAIETLFFPLPS